MVKACKLFFLLLLVLVIAGAIYAWRLKRRGFSARSQPSAVETVVARTMRNMAIPASARNEENPWKDLDNAANRKEAREHWADHCAFCHANDGSGNTDTGKNMYPKPPDMRLAATQNLTDGELYYIIENGVRLTACLPGATRGSSSRMTTPGKLFCSSGIFRISRPRTCRT